MRLYQTDSSPAALSALSQITSQILGRSTRAQIYVSGRNSRNECATLRGDGKIVYVACLLTLHFICEYMIPPPALPCSSFAVQHANWASFINTTGMTAPQTCIYNSAFTHVRTALTADGSAFAASEVTGVYITNNPGTVRLPIRLAQKFPRLSFIEAWYNSIEILDREVFQGLTNLGVIHMSRNKIKILNSAIFAGLNNLKYINFSEYLNWIQEQNFNSNIYYFHFLDENQLTAISNNFFTSLPALMNVNLDTGCTPTTTSGRSNVLAISLANCAQP
jgi:hypothetical protein